MDELIARGEALESAGEILAASICAGFALAKRRRGPNCPQMMELARTHDGRVRIASGGIPGLDIIRCAAEGGISRVSCTAK